MELHCGGHQSSLNRHTTVPEIGSGWLLLLKMKSANAWNAWDCNGGFPKWVFPKIIQTFIGFFHSFSIFWTIQRAGLFVRVRVSPFMEPISTWWLIPLSKWVITPVISGLSLLIPFVTGVITHLRFVVWATRVSQKLPTFEEFYSKQSTNWWNDAGRLLQDTLAGQNSGVVERHAGSCWRSWGRMDRITMANYGWLVVWNISYGVMMVNDG